MNTLTDSTLLRERFSAADLAAARREAEGKRYLEALEESSGLPADAFVACLAATFELSPCSMADLAELQPQVDKLSFSQSLQRECMIGRTAAGEFLLVLADPLDDDLRDRVELLYGSLLPLRLAHHLDIAARLHQYEEGTRALEGMDSIAAVQEAGSATELSLKSISADQSPIVRLVNSTLHDALKAGASDIHIETVPNGLAIKYRVDGVLIAVGSVAGSDTAEQAVSRIKVMAELDIAERRVPQDGRFRVNYQNREIDLRVSIMPSIHGEDAVLRILDRRALSAEMAALRLDSLGFDAQTIAQIRQLAEMPYGMLLVTGPTGSGKTTTLYGAIGEINHGNDKIITIEDPVEYQLPGVLQIPVNEKKGLTFARGLRSILRHDPDKIMVGEIRDGETANIAVQAALTGHLVLTTVHANNAFDVLGRFTHMGVDPYSLMSALNGVAAQRLLRMNCPECSAPMQPDAELIARSGISDPQNCDFRAGTGCGHCRGTGYRGRKAVAELLILDDELREMITNREPVRRVKDAVRARGTRLLREAALELARRGETSLEEVNRVIV